MESLKKLQDANIKYCFVTNNSKTSTSKLISKLKNIGLDIPSHSLITASSAAANIIKTNNLNPFLLISSDTIEEFEPHYSNQLKILNESQTKTKYLQNFDSVFIGLSKNDFIYDTLNIAFHCLHYNKSAKLYAINKSRYFNEKNSDNIVIDKDKANDDEDKDKKCDIDENINNLATGAFVKGLEYSTNKEAIIIGKPSKYFFEAGLNKIGVIC